MRGQLKNLLHPCQPCQPWRMTLSRWRSRIQDERDCARVWICEHLRGGHDMREEYDHLNGSIWICSRCPEWDS